MPVCTTSVVLLQHLQLSDEALEAEEVALIRALVLGAVDRVRKVNHAHVDGRRGRGSLGEGALRRRTAAFVGVSVCVFALVQD